MTVKKSKLTIILTKMVFQKAVLHFILQPLVG